MVSGSQAYSGFHLHNFFSSTKVLRNKYATYGHPVKGANHLPLGKLQADIDLAINCVTGRPDSRRIARGFKAIDGPTPIVYQQLAYYRMARQQELKEMILKDEEEFGIYNATE